MNWILLKDRIITMLFWAAIAFEVIAVWNLLDDMYYKGRKLLKRKRKRSLA